MNKKIAIIGGGIFGVSIYILLKQKGIDCCLFERKKNLLKGATTNNLNRVHFGYHYPRDNLTAKQSYKGYKSFKSFYKEAIFQNFKNYYFIAKKSKVSFKNYLKFCKKNKLKYEITENLNLPFQIRNIQGGIEVNEPIYDWDILRKKVQSIIKKFKKNKIHFNENVLDIRRENKYLIITNKDEYFFDIIIDASYDGSNSIIRKFKRPEKRKYQLVVVYEFELKKLKKMGLALMDGGFFSFLPKGKRNRYLLYHVKYSVIKEKITKKFPSNWYKYKNYETLIKRSKKLIKKDLRYYLPNLKINLTTKKYLSPRVILKNVEKTDRRVSKIDEISKNYFQIFSAKVDHSIDIANGILKKINGN